jgi:hypothetical protein
MMMKIQLVLFLFLLPLLSHAEIYRCVGELGETVLTDQPCLADGSSQQFSTLSVTEGKVVKLPAYSSTKKTRRKSTKRYSSSKTAFEECLGWKVQIEKISKELRAGYRPSRGEKLKRRRRIYEELSMEHCR